MLTVLEHFRNRYFINSTPNTDAIIIISQNHYAVCKTFLVLLLQRAKRHQDLSVSLTAPPLHLYPRESPCLSSKEWASITAEATEFKELQRRPVWEVMLLLTHTAPQRQTLLSFTSRKPLCWRNLTRIALRVYSDSTRPLLWSRNTLSTKWWVATCLFNTLSEACSWPTSYLD